MTPVSEKKKKKIKSSDETDSIILKNDKGQYIKKTSVKIFVEFTTVAFFSILSYKREQEFGC